MRLSSGLKNSDIGVALTALREMYGLNVVLSIRPDNNIPNHSYLRVEWYPATIWQSPWYAAAERGGVTHIDYPIANSDQITPAYLFQQIMLTEPHIEAYYLRAVSAGLPPTE
jgi:hypothetical protein